jgi:uncharacterized repeat protein (TIGR01451 family)
MVLDGWRQWFKRHSPTSGRSRSFRPFLEALDTRVLPAAYLVNSAGDDPDGNYGIYNDHTCDTGHMPLFDGGGSLIGFTPFTGICTLRAAIQQANADGAPATITFDPSVTKIVTAGLPPITVPIVIDGTPATGTTGAPGTPGVELVGGPGAGNGLVLLGGGSTIEGLVIHSFPGAGIALAGGPGNLIQDNYIGTDVTGTIAMPNGIGVGIDHSAGNTIGGPTAATRNLISGNTMWGVSIFSLDPIPLGNVVEGNYIGTDVTGLAALGNGEGVTIGSFGNTIGGTAGAATRNLISGNAMDGVYLQGFFATGNVVEGNFIGTDKTGAAALPNMLNGVDIAGAASNTIGGDLGAASNVISGNGANGVLIAFPSATKNVVQGNFIGTDPTGAVALGNLGDGVLINAAPGNFIGGNNKELQKLVEGNLISGNGKDGIGIAGAAASGNKVRGNFIGADVHGAAAIPNGANGVHVDGAPANVVGAALDGSEVGNEDYRNVIARNGANGVFITGKTAAGNLITGGFIGTALGGEVALGNGNDGVLIQDAPNTTVANISTLPGTVISGNGRSGVEILGSDAKGTTIVKSMIGTDFNGQIAFPNVMDGVTIDDGSNSVLKSNLISGNKEHGVHILGLDATGNRLEQNSIGYSDANQASLANGKDGVLIDTRASQNIIGSATSHNVISGNTRNGVEIDGILTNGNVAQGNYIGVDAGSAMVPNGNDGVLVGGGAFNNTIGGAAAVPGQGPGNVISANKQNGVEVTGVLSTRNLVQGSLIGTTIDGTGGRPNGGNPNGGNGVLIDGAPNNTIGLAFGPDNVISGNLANGVQIQGAGAMGNTVQGNYIGTDIKGKVALRNTMNGVVIQDASNNQIGVPGVSNLISGNGGDGIQIQDGGAGNANGNLVKNNLIGTDVTGAVGLGNGTLVVGNGVFINGAPNNAVGGAVGAGNVISANTGNGVFVQGARAVKNLVQSNSIGTNVAGRAGLGNTMNGVLIVDAPGTVVGGAGMRNLISANKGDGVFIQDATGLGVVTGNLVQNNYIGVDVTGTAPLSNGVPGVPGGDGVAIVGSATTNTIGGVGLGNVISANTGDGVRLSGGATKTLVQGNFIGTDSAAAVALGNGGNGVDIVGGATANTVGGVPGPGGVVPVGQGNTIAFNTGAGVAVVTGIGNSILGNSLFFNAVLGIDLNADGVTLNDSMGHNGPNLYQSFPLMNSAITLGNATNIVGTLHSTPNTAFRVEFFSSPFAHPSGYGEGRTFLGFATDLAGNPTLTTDGGGNATINVTFPNAAVPPGQFIAATATDPANNTSEFSGSVVVILPAAADVAVTVSHSPNPVLVGTRLTYTLTVTNNGPAAAPAVMLTDVLPTGVTFVSATSAPGTSCTQSAGTVRCSLGTLAKGASSTVPVVVIPPTPGVLSDTATVKAEIPDPNPANNAAIDSALVVPPAAVQSVVVNDGSAQRSMVDSLTVTFSTQVDISSGAFTLVQTYSGATTDVSRVVSFTTALTTDGRTVATLTFAGSGILGGSLADGRYTLTIHSNLVHDHQSGLAMAADAVDPFFRLFGDVTGDGKVDDIDRAAFLAAYRSRRGMANYRWYFDYNADGTIDSVDYFQFQRRYGTALAP